MFSTSERRAASIVLVISYTLLAGCGGGGGGYGGGSTPQNRAPVLGVVQFSTNEDTDLSAQVTATDADGDALTFTRTGDPSKGTVTAFAANGTFTYRPNRDAFGSDSFAVRVADSQVSGVIGTVTIQISATPDPPAPRDDLLTASGAGLANLNVLANDTDPDGDTMMVSIESAAEVGTATVNAGGSIAISGLPAGFRGVTRFKYRVTDPGNTFAIGSVAVFVDVDAFRVMFPADEPGQDSPELFITNLASAPVQLSAATEGTLRLRSFVGSLSGSTAAYRRLDQAQGNDPVGLSFVRTADPATQVRIQLPNGMVLQPATSLEFDTYAVSPDGQWIAGIVAKQPPGTSAVFLLNVAAPTVFHTPSPPDTTLAQNLQFSSDSQHLYFVAAAPSNGTVSSLYRTALATPDQSTLMSETPSGDLTDQVLGYSVSADQSKIVVTARRGGIDNMYYVSTANPRNEIRLNQDLAPDDEFISSVLRFGSANRIAYSLQHAGIPNSASYVAEISETPSPRALPLSGFVVQDIRPDGQAVLLTGPAPTLLVEQLVDSAQPPELVGDSDDYFNPRYDARGDALVMQVAHDIPPAPLYLTVAAAVRPTFGTTQHVGTPDKAAMFTNFAGADRAVVFVGEGPQVQPTPPAPAFRVALVNAWAPDKLLYLSDLLTPRVFRSGRALVVDP